MAVEADCTGNPCAQFIRSFCVVCSSTFLYERMAQGRRRITCSDRCRKERDRTRVAAAKVPARFDAQCIACGGTFITKKSGERRARFCSVACRQKVYQPKKTQRACAQCGKAFYGFGKTKCCGKVCAAALIGDALRRKDRPLIECPTCRTFFTQRKRGGDKNIYCSRSCRRGKPKTAEEAKALKRAEYARWRARQPQRPPTKCKTCNKDNPPNRRVFCCDECKPQRGYVYVSERKPRVELKCHRCAVVFVAPSHARRKFCSLKCKRRAHHGGGSSNSRRARKFGVEREAISRIKVFERDAWCCQVCGRKTPRRLIGTTDERAPELDHRVPMSKGGAHTYANVQCACRRCNARKGSTMVVGQMPLFARPMKSIG